MKGEEEKNFSNLPFAYGGSLVLETRLLSSEHVTMCSMPFGIGSCTNKLLVVI